MSCISTAGGTRRSRTRRPTAPSASDRSATCWCTSSSAVARSRSASTRLIESKRHRRGVARRRRRNPHLTELPNDGPDGAREARSRRRRPRRGDAMSYYGVSALRAGRGAPAAGARGGREAQEERPGRRADRHRGPQDRHELLGQGLVRQSRALQRLREPPAARADLCAQRLRDRPADRARARSRRWSAAPRSTQSRSTSRWRRLRAGRRSAPIARARSARWSNCCKASCRKNVMERVCREADGLFPAPSEIECPAPARTGRTCASTSRRRSTASAPGSTPSPDLLFTLRGVDRAELVSNVGADLPLFERRGERTRARRRRHRCAFRHRDGGAGEAGAAAQPKLPRLRRSP